MEMLINNQLSGALAFIAVAWPFAGLVSFILLWWCSPTRNRQIFSKKTFAWHIKNGFAALTATVCLLPYVCLLPERQEQASEVDHGE